MKKKLNGKLIFNILCLMVPIGLIIYFLTSENGFIDLMENASKLHKGWLLSGFLFQFSNVLIDAVVLYLLTNNYDKSYNFKKAFKATAVGQFFSIITPGAVGGQPMQLYCMSKQKIDTGIASSCLVQKFLVYQTTITLYSFFAMIFNLNLFCGELKGLMLSLALFGFLSHVFVVAFIFVFSFNKKLASSITTFIFNILAKIKIIKNPENQIKKLEKQMDFFHESNLKLYKNKKLLAITCLLTILQLTLIFSISYLVYRSFGLFGASASDMITAQAFVTMVSSFMPLPGGSGAAEGSFYVFFKIFFTQDTIKSAILIWRIITYFFNVIIFAPFASIGKINKKSENN